MNIRENFLAVLNYETYDALPLVHFGFWKETLEKWAAEGHFPAEYAETGANDGSDASRQITKLMGFDQGFVTLGPKSALDPVFETKVVLEGDGFRHVMNSYGVIELEKPGAVSIPTEIDHTLKNREDWERDYKWRYQYSDSRVDEAYFDSLPAPEERETAIGLHVGSLYGHIRDVLGIEGISYLYADDEELYEEIIDTIGSLCYKTTERLLSLGMDKKFDYAHYWEDICFKNGPLVIPSVFDELVGPWYKKINTLLNQHEIHIVSVDCDGMIDALLPTWLENGVNTMFPIEVGTWKASIAPWREKYGQELRGIGGMNKNVFALDYEAVDAEIERLKPLVALGGYIPCPDHRIPPTAKWENVQYYAEQFRKAFC